jgi:hypothetical protein
VRARNIPENRKNTAWTLTALFLFPFLANTAKKILAWNQTRTGKSILIITF